MRRDDGFSSGRVPPLDGVEAMGAPATPSADHGSSDGRPSAIALKLFASLDEEGIRYCHWKSNIRLDQTLAGIQDIDLLVDPEDAHAFQRLLNACGFKLTVSRMGVGHPGIFHALAWDPDSGRLLDLHAYHQLVSGDSLVKSFRFPVEKELLGRTTSSMNVRVPDASAELVLFVLRILLKHSSLLEIRKVNRRYGHCRDELSWLTQRSDRSEAALIYRGWFPSIGIPFEQLIAGVARGSVASRLLLGMRVAWALRHQRRIGHAAAFLSRVMRFGSKSAARLRKRRNLSLLAGGAWIALAGPKGSGKSTLTKLLAKRLGTKLDVKQVHFGKPPTSWQSFATKAIVGALRKTLMHKRPGDQGEARTPAEPPYSTLFLIGRLLIARDRQRLLARSMRAMSSGTIIISDRCPVTNARGLDGSAFDDRAIAGARSPFQRWLMKRERAIYHGLPRPRIILKLRVPLETALKRDRARGKPGGPAPYAVQRRWSLENESEFATSAVYPVDTDGDIDDTLRTVTARVWHSL